MAGGEAFDRFAPSEFIRLTVWPPVFFFLRRYSNQDLYVETDSTSCTLFRASYFTLRR